MAGNLISTMRHGKFGNVDYKLGMIMLVGTVVGFECGAQMAMGFQPPGLVEKRSCRSMSACCCSSPGPCSMISKRRAKEQPPLRQGREARERGHRRGGHTRPRNRSRSRPYPPAGRRHHLLGHQLYLAGWPARNLYRQRPSMSPDLPDRRSTRQHPGLIAMSAYTSSRWWRERTGHEAAEHLTARSKETLMNVKRHCLPRPPSPWP